VQRFCVPSVVPANGYRDSSFDIAKMVLEIMLLIETAAS
jgi:hypothetical protein